MSGKKTEWTVLAQRVLYSRLKLQGICVSCHDPDVPLVPEATICAECTANRSAKNSARRRRNVLDGLCPCGRPRTSVDGRQVRSCEPCRLSSLRREARKRAKARRCIYCQCPRPPAPRSQGDKLLCVSCRGGWLPGESTGLPLAPTLVALVDGAQTLSKLAEHTSQSERNALRHLQALLGRGLVERVEQEDAQGVGFVVVYRISRAAGWVG